MGGGSIGQDGPRYLPALTGIRALAAGLVLGMHAEQNLPMGLESIAPVFARGYLGVDFFFVLSGFIISHVYLESLARPRRDAVTIFLWHRLIRLYPVHVTVLAVLVALVGGLRMAGIPLNNPQDWQWESLFWQLTLLHAWGVVPRPGWNGPSWSISAEWFAYLLFPLWAPALARVRSRRLALALAAAAVGAIAVVLAFTGWQLNNWESHWVGLPTLLRVTGEFVCGAAICRACMLGRVLPYPVGDGLGTAAFLAFVLLASTALPDIVLVGLLALTILGTATSRGYLRALLGSRAFVWLGEVSYSVYMVHFPLLIIVRRLWEWLGYGDWPLLAKVAAFAATIALILGVAAALFQLVERPARMHLRNRFGRLPPAEVAGPVRP